MAERDEYFRHRRDYALRDGASRRRYLIELIDELLRIEASTHPSNGPCPEKNDLSIDAYMVARRLLEKSIGWAIDHRIGLVLSGVPYDSLEASDHIHEANSSGYEAMDEDLKVDRKMLGALLMPLSYGIPSKLLGEVLAAIPSLEDRKPSEFFDPKVRVYSLRCRSRKLRIKALEHLDFRRGMNVKRGNAKEEVAKAYGIESDTLDSWSTKLNQDPSVPAKELKRHARYLGKEAFEQLRSGDSTLVNREAKALERDGAAFQDLMFNLGEKVVQFPK